MAKILGTDSIKSAVPKMVELTDDFIINGQVYNKSNLSPKPFKTLALEGVTSDLLDPIMFDCAYVSNAKTAGSNPRNTNSIVVDKDDPNITYIINTSNHTSQYLMKITKTSKNIKCEKVVIYGSLAANYGGQGQIVDQDDDNIYIFANCGVNDANAYNTRISQVNKTTMSITNVNVGGGRSSIVYKDNLYIYIAAMSGAGILSVYRYTKSAASITKIFTKEVETTGAYTFKSSINTGTLNGNTLSFYYFIDYVTSNHNLVARRCEVDLLTAQATVSDVNINFNGLDPTELLLPAVSSYDRVILDQVSLLSNNQLYLSLIPYTIGGDITPGELNSIYTFKITGDNDFTLVSKKQLKTSFSTMLTMNDNNTVILANNDVAIFMKWDDTLEAYVETNSYSGEVAFVSRDMNNTIWIQNENTSVEQFSLSIPIEIYSDFEKSQYEYEDSDINTYISVYAKNFGGDYIESNITLTLTGNCYFALNNSKTLTITTSSINPIQIPVVITGASVIGVNSFVL